ncbi:hypothetical protein AA0Y32_08180 [Georgenia phoenicis]
MPNDASNTARGYLLLEQLGWFEVDESADRTMLTQAAAGCAGSP